MAKKDAIFDYGSHFDTSSYLSDIVATYNANKARATDVRHDRNWQADPGAAPGTALAGWEAGMWKKLDLWDIVNEPDYLVRDPGNKNKLDYTAAHRLVRKLKEHFNLPNPIDTATWPDRYETTHTEQHFLWLTDKDRAGEPMALSFHSGGMIHDELHQFQDQDADKHTKCGLFVPISGWADGGVDSNTGAWTVRPTATNATTYKNHYKALVDANTAAADYTSPALVGSEFTQTSKLALINFENQYGPTPQTYTESSLSLLITWNDHTYAQIKALMDAAIA
tara:strand:- start:1447 stop:2286 length:840 start_codon:yes stop_codon:yes gene_type:complete